MKRQWITLLIIIFLMSSCNFTESTAAEASTIITDPLTGPLHPLPDQVLFNTEDVDLFWKVYETTFPNFEREIFKSRYFETGSSGLQDFFHQKIRSTNRFLSSLKQYPDYYHHLNLHRPDFSSAADDIQRLFRGLEAVYEDAVFGEVVFVMGGFRTGGTVLNNRIIIGAEMFANAAGTPNHEFNPWLQKAARTSEELPYAVLHEAVHLQQLNFHRQLYGGFKPTKLLDVAIFEGAADFLVNLIAGDFCNRDLHQYANPMERRLWNEFRAEMHKDHTHNWVYNGGADTDRPADLGYYIGYKIVESYYNNATDKDAAIREIIEIRDFDAFLEWSRYEAKFKADS